MTDFKSPRTWYDGEGDTHSLLNDHLSDQLRAVWVGEAAGDMDYYTSTIAKMRIPAVAGMALGIGASSLPGSCGLAGVYVEGGDVIVYSTTWADMVFTGGVDPFSMFDAGSDDTKITVPAGMGGYWLIGAHNGMPELLSANCQMKISKNGAKICGLTLHAPNTGAVTQTPQMWTAKIVHADAGDYFQGEFYHDSVSTQALSFRFFALLIKPD